MVSTIEANTTVELAPILITDLSKLDRMAQNFCSRPSDPIFFDTETTGLDPRSSKVVTLQFYQRGRKQAVVVDVRNVNGAIRTTLQPLFYTCTIIGMNLKFDASFMLYHYGIRLRKCFDVMLAEQLVCGLGKSEGASLDIRFDLASIAKRRGIQISKAERSWFIDLDQRPEWHQPLPIEQLRYGAQDVICLDAIMEQQQAELLERKLHAVAALEFKVLPALAEVEHNGVRIDADAWRSIIAEKRALALAIENEVLDVFGPAIVQARAEKLDAAKAEYDAWELAREEEVERLRNYWGKEPGWGEFKTAQMHLWREFNPNPGKPKPDISTPNIGSTHQLLDAFRVLGIPATSTGSEPLADLKDDYPAVALLLKWRKASKFVDAFGESLLQHISSVTGRVHPEYQQIGASSGRMSCNRPNWQQVPTKGDGQRLRACVQAAPGNVILTADYSAQELCILADLSDDAKMLAAFEKGEDLHVATARLMFNLDSGVDTKHYEIAPGVSARTAAKTINYGILYGMGPQRLAKMLGIELVLAKSLIQKWFAALPGVTAWIEARQKEVERTLESRTVAGRVRYYELPTAPMFPTHNKNAEAIKQWREKEQAYKVQLSRVKRQGCNTPIQGSAADMTKLALVFAHRAFQHLTANSIESIIQIIAVVHDEVVVECSQNIAEQAVEALAKAMYDAATFYLKRVKVPYPTVSVNSYWSKE